MFVTVNREYWTKQNEQSGLCSGKAVCFVGEKVLFVCTANGIHDPKISAFRRCGI
jgi:hypothetical protein